MMTRVTRVFSPVPASRKAVLPDEGLARPDGEACRRTLARRRLEPEPGSVLLAPLVLAVLAIMLVRAAQRQSGRMSTMAPTTLLGRVAVASLALMILVAVTGASLVATIPVGMTMLALGSVAWWRHHDHGLLLTLPLVFGSWVLVIPLLVE